TSFDNCSTRAATPACGVCAHAAAIENRPADAKHANLIGTSAFLILLAHQTANVMFSQVRRVATSKPAMGHIPWMSRRQALGSSLGPPGQRETSSGTKGTPFSTLRCVKNPRASLLYARHTLHLIGFLAGNPSSFRIARASL